MVLIAASASWDWDANQHDNGGLKQILACVPQAAATSASTRTALCGPRHFSAGLIEGNRKSRAPEWAPASRQLQRCRLASGVVGSSADGAVATHACTPYGREADEMAMPYAGVAIPQVGHCRMCRRLQSDAVPQLLPLHGPV